MAGIASFSDLQWVASKVTVRRNEVDLRLYRRNRKNFFAVDELLKGRKANFYAIIAEYYEYHVNIVRAPSRFFGNEEGSRK